MQLLHWCGRAAGAGMLESHGSGVWRSCTARGGKTTPQNLVVLVGREGEMTGSRERDRRVFF